MTKLLLLFTEAEEEEEKGVSVGDKRYQTPDASVESGITHLSVLVAKGHLNLEDSISSVSSNSTLLQKTSFLSHDVSGYKTCIKFVYGPIVLCGPSSCVLLTQEEHVRLLCCSCKHEN